MRRVVATAIFLVATVVLSIFSIPAAAIDRSGRSYLWLARLWSRIFLILYGIKVEVRGAENIQAGRPTVYIANHSSYTDIPVILASVPDNIRLMLRDSLTRIPIWGWALKVSPFLIVNRSNASKANATLGHATHVIRGGAAVLLFPEGTRTHDGVMQPFKRGAFKIALDSGATLIPIAIKGTFDILPRTKTIPRSGAAVSLVIGAPISAGNARGRSEEIELMQRAEVSLRGMLETLDP